MTITSETTSVQIPGNSSATLFAFPMKVFAATDVVVGFIIQGVYALQSDGYTVTDVNFNGGGNVLFATPPPLGVLVDIRTLTPQTQPVEFSNLGSYLPENNTSALDRVTRVVQDLTRLAYLFGIHGPDTDTVPWAPLPPASQRLGMQLICDPVTGNPTVGVPTTQVITTSVVAGLLGYLQTATEALQNVAPTIFIPTLRYDPMRYGATGSGLQSDSAADTLGVLTALQIAYANKGSVWLGDGRTYTIPAGILSLVMTGNHTNGGIRIEGASVNGSNLNMFGGSGPMLALNGATPTGNPQEAQIVLENFTINCVGKTSDGLLLNGVGAWSVRNLIIGGANKAINLSSALIGTIEECQLYGSNYGAFFRQNGAGSPPNLIGVRRNRMFGNSIFAVDFNDGDELTLEGNDIEANGTSGNTATGAIHLGNNLQSGNGFAHNYLTENHVENNFGWSLLVDAQTGGSLVDLEIEGGKIIAAQSGQAIKILGGQMTRIANVKSPSPGDTWNITSNLAVLENVTVSVLTDTGITYPTYTNVATSASVQVKGRRDNFTGTGTGFSGTAPSANVAVYQQGDEITLVFSGAITGTSNSIACTITGLQSKYFPASDSLGVLTVQDNGANSAMSCQVSASTGVITVGFGHTFTGSGGKGVVGGSLTYRRP